MFCPKCGNTIKDGVNFCTKCGEKIVNNNPSPDYTQNAHSEQQASPNAGVYDNSVQINIHNDSASPKKNTKVFIIIAIVAAVLFIAGEIVFFKLGGMSMFDKDSSNKVREEATTNEGDDSDNGDSEDGESKKADADSANGETKENESAKTESVKDETAESVTEDSADGTQENPEAAKEELADTTAADASEMNTADENTSDGNTSGENTTEEADVDDSESTSGKIVPRGNLIDQVGGGDAKDSEASSEYANNQFVFPDSDVRRLTKRDLRGLSADECRIARNELYARHGRKFDSADLQEYFDSCSWYEGTIAPKDFTESMLNDTEMYNRDLITEYEKEMGYR